MIKDKDKRSSSEPALQLKLAAFCKIVLTETGTPEHSLVGLLPAITLGIVVPKDAPVQPLPIPLVSGLSVYALFERSKPIDKPYDALVEVTITGPFKESPSLAGNLHFPAGVKFTQMPIKFQNPILIFSLESGKEVQESEIKVEWVLDNVIIGEAMLPISMKRMEPPETDANDLATTDKT
jgi:hypothetical protein